MSRDFALGDILSITTDRLVSRDHIGGVYRILNYMTGDSLFTHQLPRASRECAPVLLVQHPQLAVIDPPEFEDDAHVWRWVGAMEARYGKALPVEPLGVGEHEYRDPVEEFCDIACPEKVWVVSPDDLAGK